MAPPAPAPARPPAAGPVRDPRPVAAVRRPTPPPPAWARHASTAALGLLAFAVLLYGWRAFLLGRAEVRLADVNRAQVQAEQIRRAWAELAAQGALLHTRLANAGADLKAVRKALEAAAKASGLAIDAPDTAPLKLTGHKATRITVRGHGAEARVLDFLVRLDHLPALAPIEDLSILGIEIGKASFRVALIHDELKTKARTRLEKFVTELPAPPRVDTGVNGIRRSTDLFIPNLATDDQTIRSFPKITLNGFTGPKALFAIGSTSRSLSIGQTITGDVVYADKLSVNEALLTRMRDNASVILTLGSGVYSVRRDDRFKGDFAEFALPLPRAAAGDLSAAAAAP